MTKLDITWSDFRLHYILCLRETTVVVEMAKEW